MIRGGGYADRWSLFELGNAQGFTSAHTVNCLTMAQVSEIASNQVAINTGINNTPGTGDIFVWEDVQPAPDGTLVIYSHQYTGPVPGGSSAGSSGYLLAFLRVQEFGTQTGPVIITQQPQSQTTALGASVVFSVQTYAFGTPVSYQWRKDGAPIAGATQATFSIPVVTTNHAGLYSVTVSNSVSSLVSSNAELIVVAPEPVIIGHPSSQFGLEESNVVLTVSARGAPVLKYQWQLNDANIPGATNTQLNIVSVQQSNAGIYRVVVTNQHGVAISSNASLEITTLGEILNCTNLVWALDAQGPLWFPQRAITNEDNLALQSGPVHPGQRSSVSTTVQGPCFLGFWWKMAAPNNSATTSFRLNGANDLSLQGNVEWQYQRVYLPSNSHTLEWRVLNNSSPVTDNVTGWLDEVTYLPGYQTPSFLSNLNHRTVAVGAATTFRANAAGHPPLRYQWQFNGADLPGATNSALAILNAQVANAGAYTVTVVNDHGSTNASAVLTVQESGPLFLPHPTTVLTLLGGEAWLHARVVGSEPMHYQWRLSGTNLPGATNAMLKLRDVTTNQVGLYSVSASNHLGPATGPDIQLKLTEVRNVIHISADGLGGKYLAYALQNDPERFPNFHRLQLEGAVTLNARCDYFISFTVANHLSMLTGRPVFQPEGQPETVHHGYINNLPPAGETVHTNGNPHVPYKASVFDVAHDHGLTTGILAGKGSLSICGRSYNGIHGAPDLVEPDHGSQKIDYELIGNWSGTTLVDALATNFATGNPHRYTFLHLAELDVVGHANGWGTATWFDELEQVDALLGRILATVETNAGPTVAEQTVILLTADHGGGEGSWGGENHSNPALELNYTIPLLAWGPGFPAGAELHSRFANRADAGTNRVDYNAVWQPLRNGDSGNLALHCLGLPPIPGSTLIPLVPTLTPRLAVEPYGNLFQLTWSRSSVGFILESTVEMGANTDWTPIANGIQTNTVAFSYPVTNAAASQFYRLKGQR